MTEVKLNNIRNVIEKYSEDVNEVVIRTDAIIALSNIINVVVEPETSDINTEIVLTLVSKLQYDYLFNKEFNITEEVKNVNSADSGFDILANVAESGIKSDAFYILVNTVIRDSGIDIYKAAVITIIYNYIYRTFDIDLNNDLEMKKKLMDININNEDYLDEVEKLIKNIKDEK